MQKSLHLRCSACQLTVFASGTSPDFSFLTNTFNSLNDSTSTIYLTLLSSLKVFIILFLSWNIDNPGSIIVLWVAFSALIKAHDVIAISFTPLSAIFSQTFLTVITSLFWTTLFPNLCLLALSNSAVQNSLIDLLLAFQNLL